MSIARERECMSSFESGHHFASLDCQGTWVPNRQRLSLSDSRFGPRRERGFQASTENFDGLQLMNEEVDRLLWRTLAVRYLMNRN